MDPVTASLAANVVAVLKAKWAGDEEATGALARFQQNTIITSHE
jgi:hypothetical protein